MTRETAGEGKQEGEVDNRDRDGLKDERMLSHGRRRGERRRRRSGEKK